MESKDAGVKMKYSNKTIVAFVIGVVLIAYLAIFGAGSSVNKEYSVTSRSDGGYSLDIVIHKRYWKLITAEGIFPKQRHIYNIEVIGKGKDWTYRNQKGYQYSLDDIKSNQKGWDVGFAWVNADRKHIYFNLSWVKSPDKQIPSDLNGKYSLE